MSNQAQPPKKLFQRAKRSQSKLRLALLGISGVGKTYGALLIAKGLGGRVALIDTENNSASLYDDLVEFDCLNMRHDEPGGYHPRRYVEYIKAAESEGYDVLIIDSISPEWDGVGGMLQLSEQIARTKTRGNTFTAWNFVNPYHVEFINAILQSKMHVIVTIKQKTDYVLSLDQNGKTVPSKVGLKPIQRDNFEYDYSVVLELNTSKHALASKDRTRLFDTEIPFQITEQTGKDLSEWLHKNSDDSVTKPRTVQDYSEPPVDTSDVIADAKAELRKELSSHTPDDLDGINTADLFMQSDEESELSSNEPIGDDGVLSYQPPQETVDRVGRWITRAIELKSFTGAYAAANKDYDGEELNYVINCLKVAEDEFKKSSVSGKGV
jgi:hypothetical protein